jgi:hypothetical protein
MLRKAFQSRGFARAGWLGQEHDGISTKKNFDAELQMILQKAWYWRKIQPSPAGTRLIIKSFPAVETAGYFHSPFRAWMFPLSVSMFSLWLLCFSPTISAMANAEFACGLGRSTMLLR